MAAPRSAETAGFAFALAGDALAASLAGALRAGLALNIISSFVKGLMPFRAFVAGLEEWVIETLARFNVRGERRPGRVGVWVDRGGGRGDKIAAIGFRVHRWVTYHGLSLNVSIVHKKY